MNKPIPHNMGFTHLGVKKSNFLWKIDNFSHVNKSNGEKLISPVFSMSTDDEMKWGLWFYPNGIQNYNNHVCIYLYSSSTKDFNADIDFTISLVNNKQRKCNEKTMKVIFSKNSSSGFATFMEKNLFNQESESLLQNDVLTIFCELTVVDRAASNCTSESIQCPEYNKLTILDAFEQQFDSEEFSDISLISSNGQKIRAHKFVLAARSPVFAAMFNRDMKEKTADEVCIPDIDYEPLKETLRFIYAGKIQNLDTLASGVLAAAEKYQIDGLKQLCEKFLFQNLNTPNAVETLALAHRFNLEILKRQAGKFISFHAKDVMETEAFKAVDEVKLMAEMVRLTTLE